MDLFHGSNYFSFPQPGGGNPLVETNHLSSNLLDKIKTIFTNLLKNIGQSKNIASLKQTLI